MNEKWEVGTLLYVDYKRDTFPDFGIIPGNILILLEQNNDYYKFYSFKTENIVMWSINYLSILNYSTILDINKEIQ